MDCEITNCHLYNKDCFFKTILIKKPDPKTGCSYYRRIKKGKVEIESELDDNKNKIRKTCSDKKQKKKEKKEKKRKKEKNSLQDIL